jgi:hypothetical protein
VSHFPKLSECCGGIYNKNAKCGQVENMFVFFLEVAALHLNPEISCCYVFRGLSAYDRIMYEIKSSATSHILSSLLLFNQTIIYSV